ncbi:MAG: general stress protein CsbD [Phaeodactylibacter sp.]|uniref:hypothetical protein n=1 Tax=Phaeodactylibacter sp. TaxID=1940289 RepID=UPI0032EF2F4E
MQHSKETVKGEKKQESFKMTGDWKNLSKQMKAKYDQLTDSDLKFETGKENDLLKRIESRLHKSREEVVSIIRKLQPVKA